MSQPHVTVELSPEYSGFSPYVAIMVHDVTDSAGAHLIIVEPVTVDGKGDGFHCRSNVDCAFGDTVETAFEAYIDRAKSANRSRVGFQAVVIDTIVPALEAHHDAIISQATTLLGDDTVVEDEDDAMPYGPIDAP